MYKLFAGVVVLAAVVVAADPARARGRRPRACPPPPCPCPVVVHPYCPPVAPLWCEPVTGAGGGSAPVQAGEIRIGDQVFAYEETNEQDFAEATARAADLAPAPEAATDSRPPGFCVEPDGFCGRSRWRAKTSFVTTPAVPFASVAALLADLPSDGAMLARYDGNPRPRITRDTPRSQVPEEQRNVRVRAVLLAASREDDNDYHLIIADSRTSGPCMNVEISGLPGPQPEFAQFRAGLQAARQQFSALLGGRLPGNRYTFYRPVPIPVTVEGSLFWDFEHPAPDLVGPPSLQPRMRSAWEIHPITRITFGHQ